MRAAKPPLRNEQAQNTVNETATYPEKAALAAPRTCVGTRAVVTVSYGGDGASRVCVLSYMFIGTNRIAHANLLQEILANINQRCQKIVSVCDDLEVNA
jgi:hypothetical protein